MTNYKYSDLSHYSIKAYYEVYNELGTGFLESIYEKAMYEVLLSYGLQIESQVPVKVHFREKVVGDYIADLIVENKVLIELKAINHLNLRHKAQIINYLKATKIEVDLLMNFGDEPEFERYIFDK